MGLLDNLESFAQGASNSAASTVSAPIDLVSWLLRKAGLPIPNNPVGGSDWMAEKGLTVQPKNQIAGLLGEAAGGVAPIVAAAKAPQIAKGLLQIGENAAAPTTLGKQAGMIKTPFGRIPETSAEIDRFYNQLRNKADALGFNTRSGSSNVSGSRYIEFREPIGLDGEPGRSFEVRISNHGDRYPNSTGADKRFSVDPDSRNTFEMAKDWIKKSGFNLDKKVPKQAPIGSVFAGAKASEINALRLSNGVTPLTADDIKMMGLIDDIGLLGKP